jgi:flagellar basal-body rod protein FlgB
MTGTLGSSTLAHAEKCGAWLPLFRLKFGVGVLTIAAIARIGLAPYGGAMLNRLTDGLEFQTQALMLRAERQRLLAGNIANADTPGFQAKDMNFAQALRSVTGSASSSSQPSTTHAAHMAVNIGGSADSTRQSALQAQTNLDSNGVDMDRERAAFVDNALKYEATLRFVSGSVRTTLDAMRSHNSS